MSDKPSITPELIERIRCYYRMPGHAVGGSLHVVLDDGNVHDDHVAWCIEYARHEADTEGAAIGEILLRMSKTQRTKLSRMDFYPTWP
jgi:hypothetical protein